MRQRTIPVGKRIIYEDNHLVVVNKLCGELVQSDPGGNPALEDEVKAFIKRRDSKPGAVFLGVVHRLDRPVSGAVMFAKTSKALVRLNEMIRSRQISKTYWAIVEELPKSEEGTLKGYLKRDPKSNRTRVYRTPQKDSQEAVLNFRHASSSANYHLLEIGLVTGRHHQIRAQLAAEGCPVKGDLKYGARRSNPGGGISLHSRSLEFVHPVTKETVRIEAPVPGGDQLWAFFSDSLRV